MDGPTCVRTASAIAVALALAGEARATQSLDVAVNGCEGVRISSRAAPLSRVLGRLSTALGFRLEYWADNDPPVTYDGTQPPVRVMAALSNTGGVMFSASPDPRCPGQQRLDAVWVVPAGVNAPAAHAPVGAAAAVAPKPVAVMPPDHATREYLEAHGQAPPRPAGTAAAAPPN